MSPSVTGVLEAPPRAAAPPAALSRGAAAAWREDLLLALVVAASRVPFLGAGYGTDTDTWKLARAAHDIARTGRYEASRLPGYPIQEWLSAAFWRGGPVALNAMTALFSVVAAVLMARLVRRHGGTHGWAAGLALAFVPAVYVSSAAAIDYVWALAFLLGACLAALDGRALATGVLLGLATGCRITSACFVLPLALMLWQARPRAGAALGMAVTAGVLGGACYLPVYLRYGPSFLSYYEAFNGAQHSALSFVTGMFHPGPPAFPPLLIAGQATVGVWGLLGCAALAVAAIVALLPRRGTPPMVPAPPPFVAWSWGVAIGLVLALYLRLPHDEGYLIPAVPFVLLALAARVPPRVFAAVAVALALSSFVLGVDIEPPKKGLTPRTRSPLAYHVARPGGETFVLDVLRGPALQDLDKRHRLVQVLDATLAAWPSLPPRARVITGLVAPALLDPIPLDPADPHYFNFLTRDELDRYLRAGDPVFYLPDTRGRTERIAGYDPAALGARPLLPAEGP